MSSIIDLIKQYESNILREVESVLEREREVFILNIERILKGENISNDISELANSIKNGYKLKAKKEISIEEQCEYIIENGKKKGQKCTSKRLNNNNVCSRHNKKTQFKPAFNSHLIENMKDIEEEEDNKTPMKQTDINTNNKSSVKKSRTKPKPKTKENLIKRSKVVFNRYINKYWDGGDVNNGYGLIFQSEDDLTVIGIFEEGQIQTISNQGIALCKQLKYDYIDHENNKVILSEPIDQPANEKEKCIKPSVCFNKELNKHWDKHRQFIFRGSDDFVVVSSYKDGIERKLTKEDIEVCKSFRYGYYDIETGKEPDKYNYKILQRKTRVAKKNNDDTEEKKTVVDVKDTIDEMKKNDTNVEDILENITN